jgi:DNA-binding transcriptional regulator YdaS (Cro superfamily)
LQTFATIRAMTKAGYDLTVWLAERLIAKQKFAEQVGVSKWELSRFIHGYKVPADQIRSAIEAATEGRVRAAEWQISMNKVAAE